MDSGVSCRISPKTNLAMKCNTQKTGTQMERSFNEKTPKERETSKESTGWLINPGTEGLLLTVCAVILQPRNWETPCNKVSNVNHTNEE
jgi:hypothetical protein